MARDRVEGVEVRMLDEMNRILATKDRTGLPEVGLVCVRRRRDENLSRILD